MTEERGDRARFHHAHKEDPDLWGDADSDSAHVSERRPLGATLTVRIAPDEMALLRARAESVGLRYSELVRRAVENYLHPRADFDFSRTANSLYWALDPTGTGTTGPTSPGPEFDQRPRVSRTGRLSTAPIANTT